MEYNNIKISLQLFPPIRFDKISHPDDQNDCRDLKVMVELTSKQQQQQRLTRATLPDLRNVPFHDLVIADNLKSGLCTLYSGAGLLWRWVGSSPMFAREAESNPEQTLSWESAHLLCSSDCAQVTLCQKKQKKKQKKIRKKHLTVPRLHFANSLFLNFSS